MFKFNKKEIYAIVVVIAGLFIISGVLMFWFPVIRSLKMVFGMVFLLFLPGFFILEIAFPRHEKDGFKKLDWIERITLSFALSIAVTPLVVYFLNRAGVPITASNIFLEILGLIVVLGIGSVIRWRFSCG